MIRWDYLFIGGGLFLFFFPKTINFLMVKLRRRRQMMLSFFFPELSAKSMILNYKGPSEKLICFMVRATGGGYVIIGIVVVVIRL
jgi:hypothetical protein